MINPSVWEASLCARRRIASQSVKQFTSARYYRKARMTTDQGIVLSLTAEIDLETQQVTASTIAAAQTSTPFWKMDPLEARQTRRKQYLAAHAAYFGSETTVPDQREDRVVSASCKNEEEPLSVPVSIFRPKNQTKPIRGVYLLMHGGGWYFGEAAWQNDIRLCEMSDRLGIAIVSVEYRLAPEFKWPDPRDDCVTAAVWLVNNSQREFGTTTLMIGGESAGGHLCMSTLLELHTALELPPTSPLPFQCANLVYGIYDLDGTPSMRNYGSRPLVFNYNDFIKCTAMLLPNPETIDRRSPDVSPLYANLHGKTLPPALFSVGTDDGLLDDTLFMANRWAAAGLESKLATYPGGAHGVGHFGPHAKTELGRRCHACIEDFLESFLE